MKRLLIRVSGSKGQTFKIQIQPGTKTRDILAFLKLEGYELAPVSDPTNPFAPEEDVYEQAEERERLIALTPVEAADLYIETLVYGDDSAVAKMLGL